MRQRIMLAGLLVLALLCAAGCVSVLPGNRPAAPRPTPAGDRPPSQLASWQPQQPPARETLGQTGPKTPNGPAGSARPDGEPVSVPGHAVPVPPARRAHTPQRKVHRPRAVRPHPRVRPARPPVNYDMGRLCRASDGVTDPAVTALCRDAYGH